METNKNNNTAVGVSNYNSLQSEYQEQINHFTALFLKGNSIVTIAEDYGFKPSQVFKRINKGMAKWSFGRKKGSHLTFEERRYLEFRKRVRTSNYSIAKSLGCSQSTVANELNRCGKRPYSALRAQDDRNAKVPDRTGPRKLKDAARFIDGFEESFRLRKESPFSYCARTAGEFASSEKICCQTLYSHIHAEMIEVKPEDMPVIPSLKKAAPEFNPRDGKHTDGMSIDSRPSLFDAQGGFEFGHWELDCVCGKKGGAVCLTLIEKKSHFYIVNKMDAQSQACVQKALMDIHGEFGDLASQVFKTVTTDNGSEFLKVHKIPELKGKVYYCHPGAPKEKAQNERHNGWLRHYIPKGEDIGRYSDAEILRFQFSINSSYRRSLRRRCANDVFCKEMSKIAGLAEAA